MTIKITDATTPKMIKDACNAGVIAGKVYPVGVTTNSHDGVSDFSKMYPVFKAMQDCDMVLSLHGEYPGVFCLQRERAFIEDVLDDLVGDFHTLRIVLEHISTHTAVEFVEQANRNVAATITVHHLCLTLDDIIGDKLQPHNFCKPVANLPFDRDALIKAATSGKSKFFLGTDSAPHPRSTKECSHCAAGVFSAPVAIPVLVDIFSRCRKLECLEAFTSGFGASYYGLPLNEKMITLVKSRWKVPAECDGVVPFMAGKTLNWQLAPI